MVRPFRPVPGTHKECGYLGLILSRVDSEMRTHLTQGLTERKQVN